MTRIQTTPPPGCPLPKWHFTAFLDEDDGTIYAPAAIAENEFAVLLGAGCEGVPLVRDRGHVYLPTWWLAKEYPCVADICAAIERRIRSEIPA